MWETKWKSSALEGWMKALLTCVGPQQDGGVVPGRHGSGVDGGCLSSQGHDRRCTLSPCTPAVCARTRTFTV